MKPKSQECVKHDEMKRVMKKIKEEFQKRTDPTAPLLNGKMVENFVLRVLMMCLIYAVINTFIIKVTLLQFVLVDACIQAGEAIVKRIRKK